MSTNGEPTKLVIARQFWQKYPTAWRCLVGHSLDLEIIDEAETTHFKLLTSLCSRHESLSYDQFINFVKVPLPLTEANFQTISETLGIDSTDLLLTVKSQPEAFDSSFIEKLEKAEVITTVNQLAAYSLATKINLPHVLRRVFVDKLKDHLEIISLQPLKVKLEKKVTAFFSQRDFFLFRVIEQSNIRSLYEDGTIELPVNVETTVSYDQMAATELLELISNNKVEWSQLAGLSRGFNLHRRSGLRSTFQIDNSSVLIDSITELDETQLSQPTVQEMSSNLARLALASNAEIRITKENLATKILVDSEQKFINLYQAQRELAVINQRTQLTVEIKRGGMWQTTKSVRFNLESFMLLEDRLRTLASKMAYENAYTELINLFLEDDAFSYETQVINKSAFTLNEASLKRILAYRSGLGMALLETFYEPNELLKLEVPQQLDTQKLQISREKLGALNIDPQIKEHLTSAFLKEFILDPQIPQDQVVAANIIQKLWPLFLREIHEKARKKQEKPLDLKDALSQFQELLTALPFLNEELTTELQKGISVLHLAESGDLVTSLERELEEFPHLIQETLIFDTEKQQFILKTAALLEIVSRKGSDKIAIIYILSSLAENNKLAESPLIALIKDFSVIIKTYPDTYFIDFLSDLFVKTVSVDQSSRLLLEGVNSPILTPEVFHQLMELAISQGAEGSILRGLYQAGLIRLEPEDFADANEFIFWQTLLDNNLSVFRENKHLRFLIQQISPELKKGLLSDLAQSSPVFAKGLATAFSAGGTYQSQQFLAECTPYESRNDLLSIFLRSAHLTEDKIAPFLEQLTNLQGMKDEVLLTLVSEFSVKDKLNPYLTNLPQLLKDFPDLVINGNFQKVAEASQIPAEVIIQLTDLIVRVLPR